MFGKFVSGVFNILPKSLSSMSIRHFGTILNATQLSGRAIAGGGWSLMPVRTVIRDHFPKPKETKRIKVYGWKTRMSTPEGRRIIMRRILKGKHVLSH